MKSDLTILFIKLSNYQIIKLSNNVITFPRRIRQSCIFNTLDE